MTWVPEQDVGAAHRCRVLAPVYHPLPIAQIEPNSIGTFFFLPILFDDNEGQKDECPLFVGRVYTAQVPLVLVSS